MPIRGLMYFGNLYDKYITMNKLNIYGSALVKIPNPKYIVFYNGTKENPVIEELKLSDAFYYEDKSGQFEWTATMYNLNEGKNDELLSKCAPLSDYMALVGRIKKNLLAGMASGKAIDEAIQACIDDGK